MNRLLLIGNKSDDTLSFVDTETFNVVGTTTTGRGPHEVIVTPDGQRAYVANYEGPGDSLSVVDIKSMQETHKIPLGSYLGPHGMAFSQDGYTLYVTCERTHAVIELDITSEKIRRAFRTGQEYTHMIVLTPDERKVYTANIGSGNATAIDLLSGAVIVHIATGDGCEGIDVHPGGEEVWTTNRAADTLSIIDTANDKVLETLPCPGFPIRIKFLPNGEVALVSCAKGNQVAVYDVAERKEIRRIEIGAVPIGLLIEPEGKRAYVANTEANTVAVLDLEGYQVVGRITAGQTPDGMALVQVQD
jgi:YVTN family beta-propeller protein